MVTAIQDQIESVIESVRVRSKSLSGPMAHVIKMCVQKIKLATADLATRPETVDDTSYLQLREVELTADKRIEDGE